MGKVIIHNQVTVNGAFEAPTPEEWLELDADSGDAGLEQLLLHPFDEPARRSTDPGRRAAPRAALPAGRSLKGEP
jgi:hypothetical protein